MQKSSTKYWQIEQNIKEIDLDSNADRDNIEIFIVRLPLSTYYVLGTVLIKYFTWIT